ncbi:MAG: hypothetical protein OSB43_16795, partial [Nocardioides sp.]
DCYALLFEYYHGDKRMDDAWAMMEQMKDRNILLKPYLDLVMMEDVSRATGKELDEGPKRGGGGGGGGGGGEISDDDIGEELDESIEESMGEESMGSEGGRK